MAKTRKQKEESVLTVKENTAKSKSVAFANFAGLKAKEIEDLRSSARKEGMVYTVVKKTLMKKAFEEAGIEDFDPKILPGSVGVLIGFNDEISAAKFFANFRKEHETLKIVGGILEKKFIDTARVLELAKLPNRTELLTRLVWVLNSPKSGLVNVLAGNLRGLLNVLNAIKDKKV